MYKLYRYSIVYRASCNESVIAGSELCIKSMYFLDFADCRSEACQIVRCPVPSFVVDSLRKRYKDCTVFASGFTVESLYVDDNTYDKYLNLKAIKGVKF